MELRDGDLVLRPLDRRDTATLVAELNDPEIEWFMMLIPHPYAEADAVWWVERCEQVWADGSAQPFAITDAETGAMLGSIEVSPSTWSIGYWLAEHARGRGTMTRALKLVCAAHPGKPLWLITHPDNAASQRVAEKAGFPRVGLVQVENPFRDGTTEAVRFELG